MVNHKIAIFQGKRIRRLWDDEKELWYFSVVDVVAVLTVSKNPRKYWNKLAERLRKEGSESVTKCHQLKLLASDGKYYSTDVADTETILRLVQSIPSPNAEPLKLWLARVGYERFIYIYPNSLISHNLFKNNVCHSLEGGNPVYNNSFVYFSLDPRLREDDDKIPYSLTMTNY
jgi:hypothetical protein